MTLQPDPDPQQIGCCEPAESQNYTVPLREMGRMYQSTILNDLQKGLQMFVAENGLG